MSGILAASVSTAGAADGTIVVVVVAGVWAYALGHGSASKGTIPGRLVAIVLFGVACWLLLGRGDMSGALAVASGTLRGLDAVFSAVGTLLKA